MILWIRNSKAFKAISLTLGLSFITQVIDPTTVWALTGGPSQPEVQSFEPIGTSEMVDLFSGDFVYNIPLLDVGGYPINMSYHSGIGMDQEASWVGLGWNINAGAITRGMRGIPDDFKKDEIVKEFNMRPNKTWGGNLVIGDLEVLGKGTSKVISASLDIGLGIFYNNYRGIGYEYSLDPNISIGNKQKGSLNIGLGLSANSQQGIGVNPSLGFTVNSTKLTNKDAGSSSMSAKVSAPYNSRAGLKQLSFSASITRLEPEIYMKGGKRKFRQQSQSISGGSSLPVSMQTYIPQISMPMRNISATVSAGLGGELFWLNGKARFSAYYNEQRLQHKKQTNPAYGYLYAEHGQNVREALMDFNREKDGSFTKETPALPLTNFTYDVYNVAAQGAGGMYRPHRSDVGTMFDNNVLSNSYSGSLGLDLGAGNTVKGGINGGYNWNRSTSGNWKNGNGIKGAFSFKKRSSVSEKTYEPFYFKQAGELAAVDQAFHDHLQNDYPLRASITADGEAKGPLKGWTNLPGEAVLNLPQNMNRTKRERRNQAIGVLNAGEAKKYALDKNIEYHAVNDFDLSSGNYIPLDDLDRVTETPAQSHHISEITTYRPDGSRYVFGIPAYNTRQREVTFNVAANPVPDINCPFRPARTKDCSTGLVNYVPADQDNSTENCMGIDQFFNSTELPPFAHSYLLTAVLSPDYVDRTSDGPTRDDLGTYTKLNYTRVYDKDDPYHWRVPYEANKANYNSGLKSDKQDDKGSYLYGAKEVWFLHSIETKTHVAEFYISERKDGYGVNGENGGRNLSNPMMQLDSIKLFARWDRQEHGDEAEPIKMVHFRYDYSLCKNVPNNRNYGTTHPDRGKLTLKKVFFTYGRSLKGQLSPYEFVYADPDHNGQMDLAYNPDYDLKGYDRWGNYKPNVAAANCDVATSPLSNEDFPYVEQEKANADQYASAWSLSTIFLPSGGRINIDYESDDYAFVQDKRAMQMVAVAGLGADENAQNLNILFEKKTPHNFIKVALPETISSKEDFEEKYLHDEAGNSIKTLYFKFLVDVIGNQAGVTLTGNEYEYITGYADLMHWDMIDANHAWLQLDAVKVKENSGDKTANPIAKTAWQFARLHLSKLVYPGSDIQGEGEGALRTLLGFLTDITTMFKGFNPTLRDWGFGKKVKLDRSWVRLYNPGYNKLGGGTRVKKLTISDSWEAIGGGENFEYGQEYDYTTTLEGSVTEQNPAGQSISSGVAVYEPMLGNEENPFRQPDAFSVDHRMAPDDEFYMEYPYGESFFPGASVGYSKVKVNNLRHDDVKRTATGFVQHEFYTARDFPVITRQTRLEHKEDKPHWILKVLKLDLSENMTASQGYLVELNNMHGQQKAQWVYPEVPDETLLSEVTPISGVEYFYKTDPENHKHLNNEVSVIKKDGHIEKAIVGKEIELVADMREQNTFSSGMTFAGNLDISLLPFPPAPIPIPSLWVSTSKEETQFRSVVMTKVITRYGILEKTIAHDLGSRVGTENLAFDAATGEVLLTKTMNEYEVLPEVIAANSNLQDNEEDLIYSLSYPAHWAYDRMGQAYKNLGLEIPAGTGNLKAYFVPGDEIEVNGAKAWVTAVTNSSLTAVNENGIPVNTTSGNIKVLRSGRRNMQTTPVGTVTCRQLPIKNNRLHFDATTEVLNAGAVVFSEDWGNYCECGFEFEPDPENPYLSGKRGNWRAQKSMLFLTDRLQASLNHNTNIREDGVYADFQPFWEPPIGNDDWQPKPGPWTFTSEVTLFSPYGVELENMDALERYSAATYGFDNTLPTAVASNAEYREIGFDSFEDHGCKTCVDDHFSFSTQNPNISTKESHSGRQSLRLGKDESIEITKIILKCNE